MVYLFIAAHLVADFILQPFWLVVRKRNWDGLALHGAIVLACMLLLPLFDQAMLRFWPAMLAITVVHVAADWWKVHRADRLISVPIGGFMLDQLIHFTTIVVVLSLAAPANQVWQLAASPVAPGAAYLSAYVVAACATPIAIMVWLDPTFSHAALAVRARMRSFLIGAGVVSLMLVGGILALPVTLLGFAVATRARLSPHPLDTQTGVLTMLTVAATLGAVLVALAR